MKKTRSMPTARDTAPKEVATNGAVVYPYGNGGAGYDAANYSTARGYVYFPNLNTRKEVTHWARVEIMRKARYLTANDGFAKRLAQGIPRMVFGTGLMPRACTKDRAWNKLANERFDARAGNAATYDLAGKFNFYSSQQVSYRSMIVDGDCGKVLARDANGRACIAMYEGHQIGAWTSALPFNASQILPDGTQLIDGVRVNKWNRAISYNLIQPDAGNLYGGVFGAQDVPPVTVPADVFIHVAQFNRPGNVRPVSRFAHAANNLVDVKEINAQLKTGIKAYNQMGYAIEREVNAPALPPGMGQRSLTGNPMRTQTITNVDGTSSTVKMESVYNAAGGEVPTLPEGYHLKQILDERPHPNTLEYLNYLFRDIAAGFDWSVDLLWNIANLGGANTRFVMADAQSVIENEQQFYIDNIGAREWIYFLGDCIASGELPPCPDPEWWAHEWIPPARTTVDIGRDGKLYLEQIKSGALTFKRFFGWQGQSLNEIDEWLDEMKHVADGCDERAFEPAMKALAIECLYKRQGMGATAVQDNTLGTDEETAANDPKDDSKNNDDATK